MSENGAVSLVLKQTSQYYGYLLGLTIWVYVFPEISLTANQISLIANQFFGKGSEKSLLCAATSHL